MENVVLTIHLILAICLIAVVLMQRSEGGGLGIGGGGGGGAMSGRGAATALSKLTWLMATGFLITSLTLTVLATRGTQNDSVIERLGGDVSEDGTGTLPLPPALDGNLLPPAPGDAPATPPKAN